METRDLQSLIRCAEKGITSYLERARDEGRIDLQSFERATQKTFPALNFWMENETFSTISPNLREGLCRIIEQQRWEELVNAFRQSISFGTGGIRGMMAFDFESVATLQREGLHAPILKGPNTINDLVLLSTSAGVAKFGREQRPAFQKVVIGYDSRVRGFDLASIVAQLFLAYGYTVYFFDEPCPYPEVTFAIPYQQIKADIGILISASHNDYRYNGYKLSCANGSQFDPKQRDEMYEKYIRVVKPEDIRLVPFDQASTDKLVFLGGAEPLPENERMPGFDYAGHTLINVHEHHCNHVKSFLLMKDLAEVQQRSTNPLKIAYCAFHGVGRRAVPRLLREVGFVDIKVITKDRFNELDGLFPSFCHEAGKEQQPDPGDERAATKAIDVFCAQYGQQAFDDIDILIGTDPDADRCGVAVKVPEPQRHLYDGRSWVLLPADSLWALLLWYRLRWEVEEHSHVVDAEKKFVVLSHTTSDSISLLARKHGIGVIKTWVGFAALSAAVRDVWESKPFTKLVEGRETVTSEFCHPFVCDSDGMDNSLRSINIAAMEQSNGFSILGGPPPDARSLGVGGHVRDKDGTLAALLVAEIAAWAKENGTTVYELIDQHIHLDPEIGLFVNHYEPDPIDGEYPGIEGDRKKKDILRRALGFMQFALAGDLTIAGRHVTAAAIYRTGKYDKVYEPTLDFHFPDEGIRLYFGDRFNHATIRPSGTGNSLRFHIQLRQIVTDATLIDQKQQLLSQAKAITEELRVLLKAPRND